MNKQRAKNMCTAILPFLLAACGGGGGGSSPAATNPSTGLAATPGTPATVKVGPVTGFGSVFVNGERFETSDDGTAYRVSGNAASEDDLAIGMIVRVRSSSTNAAGERIADDVEFDETLEGPVDSTGATSFVALGQTVHVLSSTYFDDGLSFADLAVGDVVEVSGFRNQHDEVDATYVEIDAPGTADDYEVLGQVRDLDTVAMTFRIGGLTVDYSAAELDDLGTGLADGQLVQVEDENRSYQAGDLVMVATEVEGKFIARFNDEDDDDDRDEFELVGLVTEVLNDNAFMIGTMEIRHDAGTEFSGGRSTDIVAGVRLEVEGDLTNGNVVVADEIEFEDMEARVSGLVNEIDVDAGRIVVMGVTVDVSAAQMEDDLGDMEPFLLSDLMQGDFVEIEGRESENTIVAEELERDEVDDSELRGLVDDFDPTAVTVTILGQQVSTSDQTVYEADDVTVSAAVFFGRLHSGQSVVEAEWDGAQADTLAPARELSLED